MADPPEEPTTDAGPEQRLLRSELSSQLADLMQVLTASQREILTLRVVVGLSAAETAEAVGSTPGAVRVARVDCAAYGAWPAQPGRRSHPSHSARCGAATRQTSQTKPAVSPRI